MIHVPALPGTPTSTLSPKEIIGHCLTEARLYKDTGVHAVAIENMHDIPYLNKSVGPEVVAIMSNIGYEIKNSTGMICGIQILAAANKEALAAAHASGLDFIRSEGFVYTHIADEGIINSDAGELLRYRKMIGAADVSIFTDIKKKHSSHSITGDTSLLETAKAAEFFLSDGVVLSGNTTGDAPVLSEIEPVFRTINLPVLIGSGINENNIEKYFSHAAGFIVGSYFKKNGLWSNGIDRQRVNSFMKRFNSLGG